MAHARVLVIDDDKTMLDLVAHVLELAGHTPLVAAGGRDGLRRLFAERPDAVVLDVDMPDIDGWETLRRIRDVSDVPVLMLTATAGELDKVRGLRSGADDYLTKPFGRQELAARIDALLRRTRPARELGERLVDDFLTIEVDERRALAGGRELSLTPLEYRLLCVFVRNRNSVLSPEQLLELVWDGADGASRDRVKLYVGYLRAKLREATGVAPIETVRGFGYRYRPELAAEDRR